MRPGRSAHLCNGREFGPASVLKLGGGFSLIELLVVLALVVVLSLYMLQSLSPGRLNQQRAACKQNLERLSVALNVFANDHAGAFPLARDAQASEEPLDQLVPRYTADTSIFLCPAAHDEPLPSGESIRPHRISYAYFMGRRVGSEQEPVLSDREVNSGPKATGEFAFSATGKPPGNNHGKTGGNFLFCDGHCEWSPPQLGFSIPLPNGVVLLNPKP